jgi:hypothetical protein
MVVLTRWKSLFWIRDVRSTYLASREFVQPRRRRRRRRRRCESLDLLFFLLRNCCEKAEMRVGNMRGVASLTLHQRRQQRWCGEEFGHLRKNLGTYEFSFGYLRICFWVPTDLLLDTYGLSFGYLRIRTASREACGRDQVPNTSLVLQPSDLVCHYRSTFFSGPRFIHRPFLDITSREGGFWARVAWNDQGRKEGRKGLL